jgi:hypothetical protein
MLKWQVFRDTDTLRARKIVIEIYREIVVNNLDGTKALQQVVVDRSRMFGGLLSTPRALERLERRINRRLEKRLKVADVLVTAGMGG